MHVSAVIGANFGDEGKGLMTDFFSDSKTVVARYNGGSQAGHTVTTPDGKRHVFNHFGSGTFAGAATFLTSFFIINPLIWKRERAILKKFGLDPKVFYANGFVTTPYDMLINEEVERSRGNARHGSCGLGINETVTRHYSSRFQYPRLRISSATNCLTRDKTIRTVKSIRDEYCMARIEELGLKPSENFFNIFNSEALLERYVQDVEDFAASCIEVTTDKAGLDIMRNHLGEVNNLVFEGAQGLLLDEEHRFFPHVTRSKPGLSNVLDICGKLEISEINVTYVTRAYMTRHGAGPFPTEDKSMSFEDKTNVPNPHQGTLRFGALDIDLMSEGIKNDLDKARDRYFEHMSWEPIFINPSIAITCVNQVGDNIKVRNKGNDETLSKVDHLIDDISAACGINDFYISNGHTRRSVSLGVLVNG